MKPAARHGDLSEFVEQLEKDFDRATAEAREKCEEIDRRTTECRTVLTNYLEQQNMRGAVTVWKHEKKFSDITPDIACTRLEDNWNIAAYLPKASQRFIDGILDEYTYHVDQLECLCEELGAKQELAYRRLLEFVEAEQVVDIGADTSIVYVGVPGNEKMARSFAHFPARKILLSKDVEQKGADIPNTQNLDNSHVEHMIAESMANFCNVYIIRSPSTRLREEDLLERGFLKMESMRKPRSDMGKDPAMMFYFFRCRHLRSREYVLDHDLDQGIIVVNAQNPAVIQLRIRHPYSQDGIGLGSWRKYPGMRMPN